MQNKLIQTLLNFNRRNYAKLALKYNPFPSITLCNYALEGDLCEKTLFHEIKRLSKFLESIWEDKRCFNVFLVSSQGTGKSTFLYNFTRWMNKYKRNVYSIYSVYPPSWGISKLYQSCLRWIGQKNFVEAYDYCSRFDDRVKRRLFSPIFLDMTLGLKRDPNKVFNKLLRKVSMEIIAALLSSVINMVMVFHKSEYLILSIDNIENVWPYISIYQRIGFLLFLEKVLSGIARRVAAIMPLPEHPSFERLMRDRFFPTFRPQYLSMDYLFELDLRREEHCMRIIREYLSKACILKHEGYYPFTERALRNIILSNTGIISKVLYDAFNLIEMASKEGSIIDERFVAKYYMQGRSSIDELALKCPATNFTRGHSWKQKRYDEEKRVWIRSCEACGITEESTTLGFRRFYAYDGKLIGETKINRR